MQNIKQSLRVELVTQAQVSKLTRLLAHRIQDSGFRPDIVIAIARGGYIPARLLCDHLDIYNLTSFRIEHYTGSEKQAHARLSLPLNADVRGKNVLLVDDITDTGDTLRVALEHIRSLQPRTLKVAALHHKTISTIVPDYYAHKIVRWRWITYPWAVIEDTLGFVIKLPTHPASPEDAIRVIAHEYGIRVPQQVMEDVYRLLSQRRKQDNADRA